MFRKLFFIPCFLFTFNIAAQNPACIDPFISQQTNFELMETLSCNPAQPKYQLFVNTGAYLEPNCAGNHKFLDLYLNNGKNIRSFSDEQVGTPGWGALQVVSACTGQNLFTITPDFKIPGIGEVSLWENTPNSVTLRNNESQILAQATKHLVSEGSCGKAIWNVTNNPDLSPQVMAYLLALKDNALFTCVTQAPAPAPLGTGVIIAAAIGAAVVVIPATVGIIIYMSRHCPKIFKRPTGDDFQQLQEQT